MKKLFFFRSSSSNNGNTKASLPTDKRGFWEMPPECGQNHPDADNDENSFRSPKGLSSKSRKQVHDSQSSSTESALRRSRSLSSAAFLVDGIGQNNFSCSTHQSRSPSSSTSTASHQLRNHSSRRRAITPERHAKTKQFEMAPVPDVYGLERPGSSCSSKSHQDFSGNSSSSNTSSKVLDRYIDGEQQQERSKPKSGQFLRNGNVAGRRPPRVQHTAPTSPTHDVNDKPKSHSFREAKGSRFQFSSRDWVENGFGHESPRRLAKNVIERLSQAQVLPPKCSAKEFDHDIPITLEDVYGGSLNKSFDSNSDLPARKSCSLEDSHEGIIGYYDDDISGFQKRNCFPGDTFGDINSVQNEDAVDMELQRRSKEAEERIVLLSEELEQESFIQDRRLDVPSLIQTIRRLAEDKVSLAIEVSGLLKSRIVERDSAKEELRSAKSEMDLRTRRLEKEKNELQLSLEKELDRRSSDWSLKVEKYQLEEQRLRERIRELAEHNVALQREVSCFNERETENRSVIAYSEQQLRHLTSKVEELSEENQDLKQNLSELKEKYTAAEENLDCIKRNFEEKEKECKELQKSITRLLRTCSEQERTIEGLRGGLSEKIEKKQPVDKFDKHVARLQTEQMRLTGVEFSLRRELESHKLEIGSLRHENINLLNRLKGNNKDLGAITVKLDREMWTRVCCLQNQGLSMLNESNQLSAKLLEYIKTRLGQLQETKQGIELCENGLNGQFFVEADVKIQSFKRGTESLTRSLQTISSLLQEKSNPVASKTHPDGSREPNHIKTSEESLKSELKAETLLTSLLREKLYSKELEVEQLQAELAAAVRGNDILSCEVQNALDNLSCASHKLKDFELQMLTKDENISRLQSDLQESAKELTIIKGILPKVSQERDLMWEEVKQYNEKNMLLNSEVNMLKKKIESLDEDILLKEGQITILKDTIGKRPFDLLASPDSMQEFLLE